MFSSINFSRPIIVASLKLLRDFSYAIMIDVIYSKIQSYFYLIRNLYLFFLLIMDIFVDVLLKIM